MALPLLVGTCRIADLIGTPKAGFLVVAPIAPDSLTRHAALNSTAPVVAPIVIGNSGGGVLDWQAHILGGSSWLTLMDTSGTAPDTLHVRLDPRNLTLGTYWDTVVVSATGASGVAQQTPIKFEIQPCDEHPINVNSSLEDTLTSADCGAPHKPNHFARLYRFEGTQNDSISVYMTSGFDGYVALDTSPPIITAPVLVQQDDCIGVSGDPCIVYQRLPATRQYWVEVTTFAEADTGEFTLQVREPRTPNLPDSLDQRALADSTTPVDTGGFISLGSIVLRARVSDPDLGDTLHLEAEVQPVGINFNSQVTATGGEVLNGSPAYVLQTSLLDNTGYHWRVRAKDQTGRTGNWLAFGGNPETVPDFSVDQPEAPTVPTALGQFEGDSSTSIFLGNTSRSDTVVLVATNHDRDPGDQLRLQVEVKVVGTGFDGTVTDSSTPVGDGSSAAVRIKPPALQNNTNYHWRARTIDQTGRFSIWVSFGGNPESGTDFRIQIPNRPVLSAINQFQSDGSTVIPQGDVANVPTVIFKGTVTDADVGQTIHLEVEVQPSGTPFTNNASGVGTPVASGAVASASVTSPTIVAGGAYHWQARAVDNTGFPSGWTPYPGTLPDTGVDFSVAIAISELVFTTQPAVDTAGRPIRPAPVVAARDANHNVVTGFNGPITMQISTNPAGATLSGTTTVNAVNGIATFSNLIIDKAGAGYRIQATNGLVNSPPSSPFNVVAAPATQLAFTTNPPASTVAGVNMNPAIVVTAQDGFFNTATSFVGPVTLAITPGTGPGGASLNGGGPVSAVNGIATFSAANITKAGVGYTLTASSGGLKSDTSTVFTITHAPATHLVYVVQPSNASQSVPIAPTISVAARDQFENDATTFVGSATLTIAAGTGTAGAVLSNGGPIAFSSAIAAFPNASINLQGAGYRLNAATTGLTGATSGLFDITQGTVSAANSSVQAAPATITACNVGCSTGASTASLITVTARDASNAVVSGASVTLSVTGTGNTVVPASPVLTNGSGVATFTLNSTAATVLPATELKIASAMISSISIVQKDTVTVNAGPATSLAFTNGPGNTTAGVAINSGTGGVVVTARDQFGNTATSFGSLLTMVLGVNPPGGVLSGTTTATASAGVGTFPNLRIIKAGAGYQLQASGGALTSPLSGAFTITTAPAHHLTFTTQPTTTAVLARIDSTIGGVVVTVQDSVNNTVPFGGTVRVIVGNPGTNPGGGTLTGGTAITAPTGIATFPSLTLNALGTGYTLQTTSSGPALIPDESTPFDIIPGPAKTLDFLAQQPTQTVAGQTITPAVKVTARDVQGNVATGFAGSVTVAIGTNGGSPPGTLTGGGATAAVNGVATFGSLSINNAGPSSYTLSASTPALPSGPVTGATSTPFNIVAGGVSPVTSTIARNPTSIAASSPVSGTITSTITVTAKDGNSNPIQGATVVIAATGTGNTLTQPATTTDINGVATGTISSTVAEPKTMSATINGTLINATTILTVNPAAPKVLLFILQPTNTVAGATIRSGTGVTVEVRDTFNNRVNNAINSVNIAILNNPGSPVPGTLSGTIPRTPVSGTVTFNDLNIDKTGVGYTLLTSSAGLVSDTSSGFNITAGAATQLVINTQPSANAQSGIGFAQQPAIQLQDANNNPVPQSGVVVNAQVASGPGGSSLTNATASTNGSGLATFSGLAISGTVGNYTLRFISGGLTQPVSNSIALAAGNASKLAITQQPSSSPQSGVQFSQQPIIQVQDAANNPVSQAGVMVTGAIFSGGGSLSGTATVATNGSGVATFTNLAIAGTIGNRVLRFTSTSPVLTLINSATFNLVAGPASKLVFTTQPSTTTAGQTIGGGSGVVVTAEDAQNNTATTYATNIVMAITGGTGTAGANLSGTLSVAPSSGVATFSNLSIDSAGTSYTLRATSGSLTAGTSSTFNINPGAIASLEFTVGPSDVGVNSNITPAVEVTARDALGNLVGTTSVSIAIGTVTAGGNLSGTSPVNTVNGVATFSNLQIDLAGAYTLKATAGAVDSGDSNTFNVN